MNRMHVRSVFLTIAVLIGISVSIVEAQRASKNASPASPSSGPTFTLSQVYGGGGGSTGTYQFDYVEIKNVSVVPLSLNTLSLMYGSSTGQFASTGTNAFALPNVTLQPGQYFLVQLSTAGSGGVALPVTPDATTTNLSMAAGSGKVALVNSTFATNTCGATATPCTLPNAGIVDLVSWGVSNNAEGGAPTNGGTALTSTQGNVRKNGGCTDTDNNNADFDVVTAPVPHNSASTPAPCGAAPITHVFEDFDGDGKTDFGVSRDNGGLLEWWIAYNAGGGNAVQFGLSTDQLVPADYDGDGKTDFAIWRQGAGPTSQATFYILQSQTNTVRIDQFGQSSDSIRVVRDYDGDGKADPSVYRSSSTAGGQSYFIYRGSLNNPTGATTYVPWGTDTDTETSGDFDGDGKGDAVVRRNINGQGWFIIQKSSGGVDYVQWGLPSDSIIPCDWDGDGKSDFCVARADLSTNQFNVYVLTRTGGGTGASPIVFGNVTASDNGAFGDFDGDGKTDIGIWRPATATFWIRLTGSGNTIVRQWGLPTDRGIGDWNATE